MSYIASSANRFYAAIEAAYGTAATVSVSQRVIASHLNLKQVITPSKRRDKTGSRTKQAANPNRQRRTAFSLATPVSTLENGLPSCTALLESGLGGPPSTASRLTVANSTAAGSVQFATAHRLYAGDGLSLNSELRFVASVSDPFTVVLNEPSSQPVLSGSVADTCVTYRPGSTIRSLSLFDYWDPAGAVHRIAVGATVDGIAIDVSNNEPQITFSGHACDIVDSASFVSGSCGLSVFPAEPSGTAAPYSTVAATVGRVWISNYPSGSLSLLDAEVKLQNGNRLRDFEMGSAYPRAVVPGNRSVFAHFTALADSEQQAQSLCRMAKQRSTVSVVLQIGQAMGQVMAIYLPNVTPEMPVFEDGAPRLVWKFTNNEGTGVADDEISIAFA